MTANELNCPKCGGVVKIKPEDDLTTHCPYCDSLIEIPERLRKPAATNDSDWIVELSTLDQMQDQVKDQAPRRRMAVLITIAVVAFFGVITWVIIAVTHPKNSDSNVGVNIEDILSPSEMPTLTPTPNFAFVISSFGQSGIGEGLFNNPRNIAMDGSGNIYVADYDNGRVQRFSNDGTYLSSWSVSEDDVHIQGLASTYDGYVFVSIGSEIKKYYGPTGELLKAISNPNGGDYGDLAVTIDGNLLAVWYEGRWGIITSLEGHHESLCYFDGDGNLLTEYTSFISEMTDTPQLDILLAVDGNGMIYAVSESTIYVFNKDGEFVDKFLPNSGQSDSSLWVDDIEADGQGRIYVLESYTIHVLTPQYEFLDNIPVGDSLNAITIDAENHIWGLSSSHVFELQLRGN
jgi:hypothetical protein